VAGKLDVDLDPWLFAGVSLLLARMGVATFCANEEGEEGDEEGSADAAGAAGAAAATNAEVGPAQDETGGRATARPGRREKRDHRHAHERG